MDHIDALIKAIDRHLEATGTAPATFGKQVLNDPNFVSRLRGGAEPRRATIRRVQQYLSGCQESANG